MPCNRNQPTPPTPTNQPAAPTRHQTNDHNGPASPACPPSDQPTLPIERLPTRQQTPAHTANQPASGQQTKSAKASCQPPPAATRCPPTNRPTTYRQPCGRGNKQTRLPPPPPLDHRPHGFPTPPTPMPHLPSPRLPPPPTFTSTSPAFAPSPPSPSPRWVGQAVDTSG